MGYKPEMFSIRMDKESIFNLIDSPLAEVLLQILEQTDRKHYKWYSNKESRLRISNKTNQSPPTVSRNIKRLVEKKILLKADTRGVYIVNRRYVEF